MFHLLQNFNSQHIPNKGARDCKLFSEFFLFFSTTSHLPAYLLLYVLQFYSSSYTKNKILFSYKIPTNIKECNKYLPKKINWAIQFDYLIMERCELFIMSDRLETIYFYKLCLCRLRHDVYLGVINISNKNLTTFSIHESFYLQK